ncbi:MAG TPA: hypothetical protein VE913_02275 [Longimicrobium sp.]|nr:hypothetical protein [Longimicrobium sp.]
MQLTHLRPMSFGEILDSAFSLYRRHFVPLFITALIPMAFVVLATGSFGAAALRPTPSGEFSSQYFAAMATILAVTFIVMTAMMGALTRQVAQAWTGAPVSVGDGYRAGFRSFFTILGSSLVLGVVSFVAFFVLAIVAGIVGAIIGMNVGSPVVTGVIVAVLAIIAFIGIFLLFASYFAFVPAIVLEGAGPLRALGRSMQLARGARWRVLGVMVTVWLIVILPTFGATLLTGGMSAFTDPTALPNPTAYLIQQGVGGIVSALTYPFMMASLVLLYYDRRVRSEAFDVQMATDALVPIPG